MHGRADAALGQFEWLPLPYLTQVSGNSVSRNRSAQLENQRASHRTRARRSYGMSTRSRRTKQPGS